MKPEYATTLLLIAIVILTPYIIITGENIKYNKPNVDGYGWYNVEINQTMGEINESEKTIQQII